MVKVCQCKSPVGRGISDYSWICFQGNLVSGYGWLQYYMKLFSGEAIHGWLQCDNMKLFSGEPGAG